MSISTMKSRTQKAKLNMSFSLLQQGVAFICGLIVPRMMIKAFGSNAYGATASIANFLAYVTLLEGGLGAVTRAALYKAFANKSDYEVSAVVAETKRLYQKVALIFILYVLIIASFFQQLSHNYSFSYWYSFALVLVIAISNFATYFIGITYSLLLQADLNNYTIAIIRIITTILNTIAIYVLIILKCDILAVKLVSSFVFVLRPVLLSLYVKKHYDIKKVESKESLLKNKKSALGQHIAWTLHNNTDITVLTLFKDSALVSVYSVYYMIVSQLQNILTSFTSGMEAVFGSMLGNEENEKLKKTFGYYETLISLISVSVLSTAMFLIIPFVRLYTSGITDTNYINPEFAVMLIIATLLYCMRMPYERLVVAAGHFKETQMAAYGEAIINIVVSIIFVIRWGLIGVAIGTVAATLFRFVYYAVYLSKHILNRKITLWIKRMSCNFLVCFCVLLLERYINLSITNFFHWAIIGIISITITTLITLVVNISVYKDDIIEILTRGFNRQKKSNTYTA